MAKLDFSRVGFARVVAITVAGTLGCMAAALVAVSYTTQYMDGLARMLTFASAFIIPVIVSAPIFYVFASKLRELAIAHHELAIIASKDSLTTCLNRGAFITLVDAYLSQVNARQPVSGGLLMVDADHFKNVNDNFGHTGGDEALRLIAGAIKQSLRTNDLVGRVGGEEFAVFLPQADAEQARAVGERIRAGVAALSFRPGGRPCPLSVSVGGVGFTSPITFNELFMAADAKLYEAKHHGRNRVEFGLPSLVSPNRGLVAGGLAG